MPGRSHYEVLGVSPSAPAEEVRRAYRTRIKAAHPDARGGRDDGESAAITEAWRVLSDPGRRLDYDRALRGESSGASGSAAAGGSGVRYSGATAPGAPPGWVAAPYEPARFPWRLVIALIIFGVVVVLVLNASAGNRTPSGPDGLITSGSCIVVDETVAAVEVPCDGPHDGVVRVLVGFDMSCPSDTEAVRDRQGMGLACVTWATPQGG
jgi:molecular chaperone DnaJ